MKQLIKNQINNFLQKRGLTLSPYDEYQAKFKKVENLWLENYGIKTVIDVGASNGGYARTIRAILPAAKIYSFEALPQSFNKLNARQENDKNFKSYNIALSNHKGEIDFYQSDRPGASSLLEMNDSHKSIYPDSQNIHKIKVQCERLDDFFPAENLQSKVLLKLDVQGAEKIVLEGTEGILDRIDLIYSEINFCELYKGAVLVEDLINYLKKFDFTLMGIENISYDLSNGMFLQADGYFKKKTAGSV